jgi:hypothetical protein
MARRGTGAVRRATTSIVATTLLSGSLTALAPSVPAAASAPAASTPASSAPAADAPPGKLVLHYDFEDAVGSTVRDRSASGLDATLVNPASASTTTGPDGSRALQLPGGGSSSTTAPYVVIPNGLFKGLRAATISTWLKWAGGADFQWVYNLGKDLDAATFVTPSFSGDSTTKSSIKPVNGNHEVRVSGTGTLPTDRWFNLVTTIDGSTITYYINGAKVGSQPASLDLAATMYSASNTTSGFLGKAFWSGHPFLAGALDEVRVYDTAFSPADVAALAGTHRTTPTALTQTSFDVSVDLGSTPSLPATANATFSDGIDRGLDIRWDTVDPQAYARRGQFTVHGVVTAVGKPVTATVTVTVAAAADLRVDLATNTGPFHGGASGTLYGLAGEGLPTRNLIEGMNLRTVSTKAQDGPQHPGADALEIVKPLTDSTGGDVYIYMTDIYRGFPYQWPGSTPEAKLADYKAKIITQLDQVATLDPKYRNRIVFVPFNEPEGNMYGTGEWSADRVDWLDEPTRFFRAWDEVYALIKGKMPDARIAGPNTSLLFSQVRGFLQHAVAAGTVPDVFTWHELSDPARIRTSVATYRTWEDQLFAGTAYAGRRLPINLNEYAFNYHTSVPGQMIQWISAIEEVKVDADIAYWNIDGNLSDSAVQSNRGNGQWWLLNAYGQMSGHTVKVTPPRPNVSYTMQGVATLDTTRRQARVLFGGASGAGSVVVTGVDAAVFGKTVHALVQEIPWTGQLGDSRQPLVLGELNLPVTGGAVAVDFGSALPSSTLPSSTLPKLAESSAYQVILTPGANAGAGQPASLTWKASYEAEAAAHTGSGYTRNGPEGTPSDVSKFFTSGTYNVGGLRTGSDLKLNFTVSVPATGVYDLSVIANSLNTYRLVAEQGPTNVFLTVDGGAEQELFLPLGYKWVVWDHTDTRVALTQGTHVITLAARSLDGTKSTKGDAIIDRIDLSLANPAVTHEVYEAEYARLAGTRTEYGVADLAGSGAVDLGTGGTATFWVYAPRDGYVTLGVDTARGGRAMLAVNGRNVNNLKKSRTYQVFLLGGVNKVTLTGESSHLLLDRIWVQHGGASAQVWYEAESARIAGTAQAAAFSRAGAGRAVTGIGGERGNGNTLTFDVTVPRRDTYALTIRYSNPEQSPATHYNPDPLARHADLSVNGAAAQRVLFPHTFHANNFWEQTVFVTLQRGANTIRFSAEELPDFGRTTLISDRYPDLLRSKYAPVIDKIAVTPFQADTSS